MSVTAGTHVRYLYMYSTRSSCVLVHVDVSATGL